MKKVVLGATSIGVMISTAVLGVKLKKLNRYDEDGYNGYGYDKDGYNRDGYNRNGYNRVGFKKDGCDIAGFHSDYYYDMLLGLKKQLKGINALIQKKEYKYALQEIRIGLEKSFKAIVTHWKGNGFVQDTVYSNMCICDKYGLLEPELIKKAHNARRHCNDAVHDNDKKIEHNQVYFAYKTLDEVVQCVKKFCNS